MFGAGVTLADRGGRASRQGRQRRRESVLVILVQLGNISLNKEKRLVFSAE